MPLDTIFAISSGARPAAIAIMRLSGRAAIDAAKQLAGDLPVARTASVRALRLPDGTLLDRALVLVFPGPASATGEDLVELHLHGGRAVVAVVEDALAEIAGLRRADPGEFTRRALMNGRIDLTQAEGLGDLLMAETEGQRRLALMAAEGGIRRRIEGWADRVVALAAEVEAALDFADEDDVGTVGIDLATAAALASEIDKVLGEPQTERMRDGIRVAIAGPPNSGKSTLLNVLVDREAAIVAPIAGTTRDVIEVPVSRQGIAYVFLDTAGLRDVAGDAVEAIGMERARRAAAMADIVLWLGDDPPPQPEALWLHSRSDEQDRSTMPPGKLLAFSAQENQGLSALWGLLERTARLLLPKIDGIAFNERQRQLLQTCSTALGAAGAGGDLLIVAEELRHALQALHAITGRTDTEAVLDSIFARFCIGK